MLKTNKVDGDQNGAVREQSRSPEKNKKKKKKVSRSQITVNDNYEDHNKKLRSNPSTEIKINFL